MKAHLSIRAGPQAYVGSLCLGISLANGWRFAPVGLVAVGLAAGAGAGDAGVRRACLCVALGAAGWWWGSVRLDALDGSVLRPRVDTAQRTLLVVTGPVRHSRYELRLPVSVRRFGALRLRESALLQLPPGRAPPQGSILEAVCTVRSPRGPEDGFDERGWLRRHGVHVVLRADRWRRIGSRTGLGGLADRLRARLEASAESGLRGERRALVEAVVLGEDEGLSEDLRRRFRASGLYHLLAVSGQNVALVAAGVLALAWLVGLPRWVGQIGALGGIGGYVLAVGPQPSVVRAGIAGALGSLAWLAARPRDRWHFLLVGALALLAWNPYTLLDPGFQLSFSAVVAIFVLAPGLDRRLAGYPLPRWLRAVLAVSTACGIATAPVLWLQFQAVSLVSVPANALAAPAVVPLLGLALAAAVLMPVSPDGGAALAWLSGWCAAYVAACARVVGALPFAQVTGTAAFVVLAGGALAACAYAWSRWRT